MPPAIHSVLSDGRSSSFGFVGLTPDAGRSRVSRPAGSGADARSRICDAAVSPARALSSGRHSHRRVPDTRPLRRRRFHIRHSLHYRHKLRVPNLFQCRQRRHAEVRLRGLCAQGQDMAPETVDEEGDNGAA